MEIITITPTQCYSLHERLQSAAQKLSDMNNQYTILRQSRYWDDPECLTLSSERDIQEKIILGIKYEIMDLLRPALEPMRRERVIRFGEWEIRSVRTPGVGRGFYTIHSIELWFCPPDVEPVCAGSLDETDHVANSEAADEWRIRVGY